MNIPPYITERKNGIDWYKYLHIRGGSGDKNRRIPFGGEFDYLVYYASPADTKNLGQTCERLFCVQNSIPHGIGNTIEEAYKNYLGAVEARKK